MKKITLSLSLALCASTAFASGFASPVANGGSGGSVVGSGNSNNDVRNTVTNLTNTDIRNTVSNSATGGTVSGSGNSSNDNRSSATGGSVVGSGNSSTDVRNDNRSSATATGGSVFGSGNSSTDVRNDNSNSSDNSSKTNVTVHGDTYEAPKIPVATAVAATTIGTNGTCMGSTSAGGQGITFGLSVSSTWKDTSCERRYNSIRLQELGMKDAATALMCQDETVRTAMEEAGTPCPATKAEVAAKNAAKTVATAQAAGEPTDPHVRHRMGLAPLPEVK